MADAITQCNAGQNVPLRCFIAGVGRRVVKTISVREL